MASIDRKRSDISIEEISSSECTPASSRRSSGRNISQEWIPKKSRDSLRDGGRKPKFSNEYHTNLTKKLTSGNISTSSKIEYFEKLSNEQKANSNKLIYEIRGRKKQVNHDKTQVEKKEKNKRATSLQEVKSFEKQQEKRYKSSSNNVEKKMLFWGDKRLSVDVPTFSKDNVIDEKNENENFDIEQDEEKIDEEFDDNFDNVSENGIASDCSISDEEDELPTLERRNTIRDASSSIDMRWETKSRSDSQTDIYSPVKRQRKFGITHLQALDNLDKGTLDVIEESYDTLNMDSGSTPRSFEEPSNLVANKGHVFVSRSSLDNVDEEQEVMTPTGESSPPSFNSASWVLEKKKKEILSHVNSPVQERKIFDDNVDSLPFSYSEFESNNNENSTAYSTMFGYFNYYLYVFITKEYGNVKWKEIVKLVGLSKEQCSLFEVAKHVMFNDRLTDKVLQAAVPVLHTNIKLFINKYGVKYYDYCSEKYGDILRSIATNLTDFINNMDDIQRLIHKIENIPDDSLSSIHASIDKKGMLSMYYRSSYGLKYLEFFLMGFIKRVAWNLFGIRTRITLTQKQSKLHNYSIVSIKSTASFIKKPSSSKLQMSNKCKDLIIEPDLMDRIFPFHFILNEKLEITQLGDSLNRLLENFIPKYGYDVRTYFKLDTPNISFSYEAVQRNLNTSFIISMFKQFTGPKSSSLVLKGQIGKLDSSKCIWFIGSPKVDYVKHLNGESDLFLCDIPLHDVTREVLLMGEQKQTLKDQLQTMTKRLKETSKELAIGKINTEHILDQMFPKEVADKLMRDLPVPAVTTETVTILFTEIVGFTAICERCDPEEVTEMLNKLYLAFDYLCEFFKIYKVETIGDAYMAVGGLHDSTFEHGPRVTAMGVEMVKHAANVSIPRSEDNLQIRVGIHSGSVVAGVVGTLMPRYCLFGKNVTLANKMESTSQMGKVHLSPYTYLQIKHYQEFIFWERPRDVMPDLMDLTDPNIKYVNSFFVDRHKDAERIPNEMIPKSPAQKTKPYMMQSRHAGTRSRVSRLTGSHRNSQTESTMSEYYNSFYPEDLRIQIEALDKLNGKGSLLLKS